jgi:hypothetical protein
MTTIKPAKKFAPPPTRPQSAQMARFSAFGTAVGDRSAGQRRGLRPIPKVAQPIP